MQQTAFFFILSLIGIITSYTDITQRKIRNNHLLFFTVTALITHAFIWLSTGTAPVGQIINFLIAAALSTLLYANNMWRGGDSKLFMLYALIMPATKYDTIFLTPAIAMFTITFLLALAFLIPTLVLQLFANRKNILREHWRPFLYWAFISILGFMPFYWLLYPVLDKLHLSRYPIIVTLTLIFILPAIKKILRKLPFHITGKLAVIPFLGLALRLFLAPESLTWAVFSHQINHIFTYTVFFYLINVAVKDTNDSTSRIAFAPFLFAGSLLCYTNLLSGIAALMHSLQAH
ncbi:MAG: prepilin peptidase [Candidatus Omnitrophica bacterium]|nr:prepilin peptidase [Candidatus Omnitrophota bacterium]